jgi:hypothetical protein
VAKKKSKSKSGGAGVLRHEDLFLPKERKMKKFMQVVLATMLLSSLFFAGSTSNATAQELKILEFDTMIGVPAGLTGTQSQAPLRGISGGGIPWMIGSAKGELSVSGKLEIEVQGLVFAAGPNIGKNTVTSFRAIVSCVTSNGSFQNILTDAFPATTGLASEGGGNAKIETNVDLPQPCIAPIVFVTSPGGSWFAATGF